MIPQGIALGIRSGLPAVSSAMGQIGIGTGMSDVRNSMAQVGYNSGAAVSTSMSQAAPGRSPLSVTIPITVDIKDARDADSIISNLAPKLKAVVYDIFNEASMSLDGAIA